MWRGGSPGALGPSGTSTQRKNRKFGRDYSDIPMYAAAHGTAQLPSPPVLLDGGARGNSGSRRGTTAAGAAHRERPDPRARGRPEREAVRARGKGSSPHRDGQAGLPLRG